jgi:hypothetical protein
MFKADETVRQQHVEIGPVYFQSLRGALDQH